jgi:hypothetical protein
MRFPLPISTHVETIPGLPLGLVAIVVSTMPFSVAVHEVPWYNGSVLFMRNTPFDTGVKEVICNER